MCPLVNNTHVLLGRPGLLHAGFLCGRGSLRSSRLILTLFTSCILTCKLRSILLLCDKYYFFITQASALTALPFFLRLILGTMVIQIFHWYRHNAELNKINRLRKYLIVVCEYLGALVLIYLA